MIFAQISDDNKVENVIVAEQDAIDAREGVFIRVDEAGLSPKNVPGIGWDWRPDLGGFLDSKPYPSWHLDEAACAWRAPVEKPTEKDFYDWDEVNQVWV